MNNGKVRIYELSKELNLENRDILTACEQLGIAVKSHSSTISDDEADKIRAQAPKLASARSSTPRSSAKPSSTPALSSDRKPKPKPAVKKQQILEIRRHATPAESSESVSQELRTDGSSASERPAELKAPVPPATSSQTDNLPEEPQSSPSPDRSVALRPEAEASSPMRPEAVRPDTKRPEATRPEGTRPEGGNGRVESGTAIAAHASNDGNDGSSSNRGSSTSRRPQRSASSAPAPARPKPPSLVPPSRPMGSSSKASEPRAVPAGEGGRPEAKKPEIIKPEVVKPEIIRPNSGQGEAARTESREPRKIVQRPAAVRPDGGPTSPGTGAPGPQGGTQGGGPGASSDKPRPSRPSAPSRPVKAKDMGGDRNQRSAPPQIVELQRPKLVRPPSRPEKGKVSGNESEENEDIEVAAIPPVLPDLERPRRPAPPAKPSRRGKVGGREEFDDGESPKKAATKPKRRVHIIGDDDDDLLDDLMGADDELSAAMSISLARPPKPKGAPTGAPTVKPTAATKGKRRVTSADRRRERQRARDEKPQRPEMITISGGMTVQEMSDVLATPETDIIRILFFKGIAATITQTLDVPTIELVCEELGVLVDVEERKADARKTTEVLDASDMEKLQRRPPVVTIMGHVDHGKTTLLDSIRKTKVAQGEAGGITQHIGAYHVDIEHNGEPSQIVFLDTPGHEAFTAMRARGTKVTDIAVLVVAADDGVRPQTIEAISHAKAAKVPLIVAINKIDKEGAQPDRVKQELTEHGLVAEEWGGDTITVPVSALQGENLDQLLEMILLVADVEELSANPDRTAKGTVIEANLDKARGPVATFLIQNGTLKVGDVLVAGAVLGRVRAMIDDRGNRVNSAGPSFAVEVLGLSDVPAAGDEFAVYTDEKEARSLAGERATQERNSRLQQAMASRRVTLNSLSARAQEGDLKELNLLIKSDVQGSLEAILKSLGQLPQDEIQLRVLLASPGEITETDVDLAAASDAVILGFNTTLASGAKRAADEAGVDVREYDIIYKLLEDVQGAMEGLLEPEMVEEPLGQIEVRAVFPVGRSAVAGCYVQSGKAIRNCNIRVHRGSQIVYTGTLGSLRRVREDVKEVNAGYECGIGLDNFNDWKEGDIIETYKMVSKRRTLNV